MRIVRGRTEARWLPSRYDFALFRLAAYVRLRAARDAEDDAIYFVDRHQSAVETWSVGLWIVGTLSCFLAASLFAQWPVPVALLAAFPLVYISVQVPVVAMGLVSTLVLREENHISVNSFVLMTALAAVAAWYAAKPGWVRFAAWQVFAMLALNALAAVVVFLLREPIARAEARVGAPGASSSAS